MQDLKVTLVQANQIWEDKSANFLNYERLLKNVSETDIIILPEMFNTGFTMNTDLKESFEDSESLQWLEALSKQFDAAIYTSLIIEDNNRTYNRGVFVKNGDPTQYYDKIKTFGLAREDNYFSSGETATIVSLRGWKIALQICYDLRFPENILNKEVDNEAIYDVLLYIANWPEKRGKHWKKLLSARAIENQCYTIGVNRIGKDENNLNYSGDSITITPDGNALCKLTTEDVKTVVLSAKELLQFRKKMPFLKDRDV